MRQYRGRDQITPSWGVDKGEGVDSGLHFIRGPSFFAIVRMLKATGTLEHFISDRLRRIFPLTLIGSGWKGRELS